jgi:hypothetical protein
MMTASSPCATHQLADPWARLDKPERFGRDVRVIHPLRSKDDAERAHQKRTASLVPAWHRAPEFQVWRELALRRLAALAAVGWLPCCAFARSKRDDHS